MTTETREQLRTLPQMARLLGVTSAWLRAEADAGRIPHIRTDNGALFERETVERVMLERAKREGVRDD